MSEIINKKKEGDRLHLNSKFMRESLVSKEIAKASCAQDEVDIIPYLNVISVGGSSILDRGRSAVYPLVEELAEVNKSYQFVIGVSGGARMRHSLAIGLDFGLPTGGLATIVGAIEEQNALMMYSLMAKHGAVRVPKDHYTDLPHYLENGMIPVLTTNPPHHYWEKPPKRGVLPENGSDFGAYMTAEVLGARSMIFIKDQDGLYDKDPKKHSDAQLIKRISAQEILEKDQEDLIVDYSLIEMLTKARHVKEIHIINGLKRGLLIEALRGKNAGTIIYKDE